MLWSLNRHHHTHAAVVMASRGSFWKAAGDQWDLFLDFQARHRIKQRKLLLKTVNYHLLTAGLRFFSLEVSLVPL